MAREHRNPEDVAPPVSYPDAEPASEYRPPTVDAAPPEFRMPAPATVEGANPPLGVSGTLSTYNITDVPWLLSPTGSTHIRSYTFDASTVSADANGDKVVRSGTVLSATSGGKAQARTGSQTACGILRDTVNLRWGDDYVGMVIAGRVNQTRLRDNGSYGSVASGVKTDLPFVQFLSYDG